MIQKILGADIEKTFGELTLKASPLPYFAYAPLLAEHYESIWALGASVLPLCVIDFELEGVTSKFTSKTIAGSKRRLVSTDTLACIPPDLMPEVFTWINEIHKLTEVETGN